MPAANYDLYIEQGATYSQEFVWKDSTGTPINLSTYTARMQVRQVKTENIILNLTSGSGITLGSNGSIKILVSATGTSALPILNARYDLELQNASGVVTRLLQGDVVISAEVTR
jgi:hypothetical protein